MGGQKYNCDQCSSTFTRKDSLKRHISRRHNYEDLAYECMTCGQFFNSIVKLRRHRADHQNETGRFILSESALRGNVKSYTMLHSNDSPISDVMRIFSRFSSEIASLIFAGKYI